MGFWVLLPYTLELKNPIACLLCHEGMIALLIVSSGWCQWWRNASPLCGAFGLSWRGALIERDTVPLPKDRPSYKEVVTTNIVDC